MTLAETARWAITLVILGAASSLTTSLVVEDRMPLGEWRDRWIAKHPPRHPMYDATNETTVQVGSRFSYLLTCARCAGVWNTAAWFALYALTGRVGLLIAVPFAGAAVQRAWNGV